MNQLENRLFPDIGVRKAQATLQALGLELCIRSAQKPRRPDYLRMLLDEAPVQVLKGTLDEVGKYTRPGRVAGNLLTMAETLGSSHRVKRWMKNV